MAGKEWLALVRAARGWSREWLAAQLGVASSTVYHWELGYAAIPHSAFLAINALQHGLVPRLADKGSAWLATGCASLGYTVSDLAAHLRVTEQTARRYYHGLLVKGTPRHVLIAVEAWLMGVPA